MVDSYYISGWYYIYIWLIVVTFMVSITFIVVITFMGDTALRAVSKLKRKLKLTVIC